MNLRKDFTRALATVRRSGVAAEFEKRLRTSHGGAPRCLDVEMLLAAAIVATRPGNSSASHVRIHKILSKKLYKDRYHFGFNWNMKTNLGKKQRGKLTLRQVRYLFNKIIELLDYSPHTTDLNEEERIEAEHETYNYLNRLVRASIPQAMPTAEYQAIDATAYPTWSRPVTNSTQPVEGEDYRKDGSAFHRQEHASFDPDARWGRRTETFDNGGKFYFGHKVVATVGSYAKNSRFKKVKLLTALCVLPNGAYEADPTIRMVDEHLTPHNSPFIIETDRGFSNSDRAAWSDQLLPRGIDQFLDMNPSDLTIHLDADNGPSTGSGALMFAGWPFVPWTPKELFENVKRPLRFTAVKPGPGAKAKKHRSYERRLADVNQFRAAIKALGFYALSPNGKRGSKGDQRFFIPTHDKALATRFQRNQRIFQQTTIRIKHEVLSKHHQPHRWGTDEWITAYSHRTDVEGVFGNLKSADGQGVRRGWSRAVGLAAMALMLTLATVHYNMRMVDKFAKKNKVEATALYAARDANELLGLLDTATLPPQAPAPPIAV